ncbi:Calmodulin [Lamellibrachia satsuma]|nr:Calmodulin [Lamellibrachia satsuma]
METAKERVERIQKEALTRQTLLAVKGHTKIGQMDFTADQFTPEKLAEVQEVFSLFDKDQDGFVPLSQLGGMLRSVGYNPTDAEVKELKSNHEGRMAGMFDFTEFMTFLPEMKHEGDTFDELDEAFRVFVKDGLGNMSAAHLRHVMTTFGEKLDEKEVTELISFAETDAQGELSYKDLIRRLLTE